MKELVLPLSAEIDIQQGFQYYEDFQEGRGEIFPAHLESYKAQIWLTA